MPPIRITRRTVDDWLRQIEATLASIVRGRPDEMKARLGLLQRRVERWREDVADG